MGFLFGYEHAGHEWTCCRPKPSRRVVLSDGDCHENQHDEEKSPEPEQVGNHAKKSHEDGPPLVLACRASGAGGGIVLPRRE